MDADPTDSSLRRGVAAAVGFVQVLRGTGIPVPTGSTVLYAQALAAVDVGQPAQVYWAGRATLVRRVEDVPLYDQAFAAFFGGTSDVDADGEIRAETAQNRPFLHRFRLVDRTVVVRYSPAEVLRHKDLAACTPGERDEAYRLIADLRVHAALRRSRRRRPDVHGRGRPDVRRTVRRAMRTGGEVVRPAATRPGARRRRLVLLLDVSGSMEPYARALARFAHTAVAARRRGEVEVFALGTRVTRITRELSSHDPDEALTAATAAVADWAGGTRLGSGIQSFNDRWGIRGLARGAVVMILSDGWDRGDQGILSAEMARLHRVVHRLVWVNPLKATPGYAPLAQGMAAALPHVDEFVEGHSVASLDALAELVGR